MYETSLFFFSSLSAARHSLYALPLAAVVFFYSHTAHTHTHTSHTTNGRATGSRRRGMKRDKNRRSTLKNHVFGAMDGPIVLVRDFRFVHSTHTLSNVYELLLCTSPHGTAPHTHTRHTHNARGTRQERETNEDEGRKTSRKRCRRKRKRRQERRSGPKRRHNTPRTTQKVPISHSSLLSCSFCPCSLLF